MSADVIELFPPRTCGDSCEHAAAHPAGVFCLVFHQSIWDERVANTCRAFDPVEG